MDAHPGRLTAVRHAILSLVICTSLLSACTGDDAGDAAATTVVPATTTSTHRSATTTTSSPIRCSPAPPPEGATDVRDAVADLDGDGDDDQVQSYRVGEAEWHVRASLARGGGADVEVTASNGSFVRVLGGADVDRDGADELWAQTGQGASATILGIVRLIGCDLVRVTAGGGEPAELPVGGSVGTASGVECSAKQAGAHLTTYTASNQGGDRYEVRARELELDGRELVLRSTYDGDATIGDETFARASSFACGDLTL